MQTDDFQIHHWIFVNDTVDVVYPPDDWLGPESLLDRLGSAIEAKVSAQRRAGGPGGGAGTGPASPTIQKPDARSSFASTNGMLVFNKDPDCEIQGGSRGVKRRPMLHDVKRMERVEELRPFLSHVSLAIYEALYATAGGSVAPSYQVDMDAVEESLLRDMFDGDD